MPKQGASKKGGKAATALKMDRLTAKDLNAAAESLFTAAQRGNVTKLSGALAPDFNFIDERGMTYLMANCVAEVQSMVGNPPPDAEKLDIGPIDTKLKVGTFKVDEVQTRTIGETVIQTMLYTDTVAVSRRAGRGKSSFNRSFRWTNVWVAQKGTYQLALTQLTPVQ